MTKFVSRKFLIAVAAFLASLGAGISGLMVGNDTAVLVGGICCVVSASIYAACEAYVDGKSVSANGSSTVYEYKVSATSNDKTTVANAITTSPKTVDIPVDIRTD